MRGRNIESAQFVENVIVDKIIMLGGRVVDGWFVDHSKAGADRIAGCPDDHSRLTAGHRLDASLIRHSYHIFVVRFVANLVRDVLPAPVGKVSGHQDLMGPPSIQKTLWRENSDPLHVRLFVFITVGCPCLDPIQDGLIVRGSDGQAFSSFVINTEGGLLQDEALLRFVQIDSWMGVTGGIKTHHLEGTTFDNPTVIFLGVYRVEGKFKATPSLDTSVTVTGIATAFSQYPTDVAWKTDG